MAIALNSGRQELLVAWVNINLAEVATGADELAIEMPNAYVITGGNVVTDTAWNSTTSDVISVGDPVAYNTYLSAGNFRAAAALVPLVPTGVVGKGNLTVRWVSGGGTPTTGASRLYIEYFIPGREEKTYG